MVDVAFTIPGFIQNKSQQAYFRLQKKIPAGGKITFNHAYKVLAKKSGLDGEEFLAWLKENIFTELGWVFINPDGSIHKTTSSKDSVKKDITPKPTTKVKKEKAQVEKKVGAKGAGVKLQRKVTNRPRKSLEISPSTIIEAEPELAKNIIAKCSDQVILKKALTLSKHFSKKEEHMRALIERLQQV